MSQDQQYTPPTTTEGKVEELQDHVRVLFARCAALADDVRKHVREIQVLQERCVMLERSKKMDGNS